MDNYDINEKIKYWKHFFGEQIYGYCIYCEIKPLIKLNKHMKESIFNINNTNSNSNTNSNINTSCEKKKILSKKYRYVDTVRFAKYKEYNGVINLLPVCNACFNESIKCDNSYINDIPVPMNTST